MTRITRTLMESRRAALGVAAIAGLAALLLFAGRPAARQIVDAPVTCNICPAESTQTPYWKMWTLTFAPGQLTVASSPLELASPSGGRLVIEHVSAVVRLPAGQTPRANLQMQYQATTMRSFLTFDADRTAYVHTSSSPMRIQVPSTSSLFVQVSRNSFAGAGEAFVYIYGYTLNVE